MQTDEAFRNLDTMLQAGGGDRHSLMRQNTYFRFFGEGRDVTEYWEKMTNVRRRYMSVPSAAGAGLRITGFPNADELIQVEGIGVLGEDKQRLQPANHWDWSIANSSSRRAGRSAGWPSSAARSPPTTRRRRSATTSETQTRNVFEFIRNVLAEGGPRREAMSPSSTSTTTPTATGPRSPAARQTIAACSASSTPSPGPAVTAVRVSGFAFEDLLIEIEAMAVTRD